MNLLLFLNGEWAKCISDIDLIAFDQIICADGAARSFYDQFGRFPDLVMGDGDSLDFEGNLEALNWIKTPNQDFSDFEKILQYLTHFESEIAQITIYGATGKEVDHFLGNLAIAKSYSHRFDLIFYDDFSCFFYLRSPFELDLKKGSCFSLMPMSNVQQLQLSGARYQPQSTLTFGGAMSLRNEMANDQLCGSFESGHLLIVISKSIH